MAGTLNQPAPEQRVWNAIVDKVSPYIVKVETPSGHGTGFLCLYNDNRAFCGIATAWHVVRHANEWQEPIRLRQMQSNTSVFLNAGARSIFREPQSDSAVIVFGTGILTLPATPIPLFPTSSALPIGTDVGWLGFPAIAPFDLCFFSGTISARQEWRHAYLIDGVAINGVSGGPVVHSTDTEGVQIVGTISAYVSNTATGDTLPGLSIARDVSHFHDTIKTMRSLDEAQRERDRQAQLTSEAAATPQTADPNTPPAATTPAEPPAPAAPTQRKTAPAPKPKKKK
jgi:hypothetical protein